MACAFHSTALPCINQEPVLHRQSVSMADTRVDRPLVRWTASFLRPYRTRIAGITLLSVTEVALAAAAPWTLKLIVDHVLMRELLPEPVATLVPAVVHLGAVPLLCLFATAGLLMQLGSEVARMIHTQLQVDMGQRVVHSLRSQLLAHLQALPMSHHVTHHTSESVYRLDADAYCVNDLVTGGVFPLALAGLNLVVMFTILLTVDTTLALMALAVTPFLYLCLRYHTQTLVRRAEIVKTHESSLIERAYETLRSIGAIKSFTRERYEHDRFVRASTQTMDARLTLTWQESLFSGAVTTVTLVGTALILVVGGLHVLDGSLQIGTLLVVIAYIAAVYDPIASIAHTIGSLQQAVVSATRVQDILSLEAEVPDAAGALTHRIAGHIRFEDVAFSYDGKRAVLNTVNFEANPDEIVAIVGLTGAGKTTLANLIPRFFDATSGRVLIDDINVTQFSLRSLRQQVALVPQDPVLVAGTVIENIRFGRLDASDAEIEQAARAAQIHDCITALPDGYNSGIGEDGASLSGGERQRLGLARAFLKNAPILILDEPTSAVDAISEEAVFDGIRQSRIGRTTVVIAHRLSTIRDATRIVVVHEGRVTAIGTHDSLLAHCDLYRRLWAKLARGRSLDEQALFDGAPVDTTAEVTP